jgi:nicotinamidase-related amidase
MNETLPAIDPKMTALLVMDYQPAILGMLGESAPALLASVGEAIRIARAHGVLVAYVRVAFDDADYDSVPPHSRFAPILKAVGKGFHSDSPATAVHDDIAPQAGDIVVRKTRIGAFSTTDLDRQLKDRGIVTLFLAGISTSGVVLSTVRDAADRDYHVIVVADACADPKPEVHEFLIGAMFPAQALVLELADLERLFSKVDVAAP